MFCLKNRYNPYQQVSFFYTNQEQCFYDKKKVVDDNVFHTSIQSNYFYAIINKATKMSIAAKNQFEMKLLKQLLTAKLNPWIGILVSLLIIVPSLYQILDDVTVLRKEYLFLALGFPLYVKSLKNLFDEILKTTDDL